MSMKISLIRFLRDSWFWIALRGRLFFCSLDERVGWMAWEGSDIKMRRWCEESEAFGLVEEDNARSIRDIVTFVGVYFEREHSPWGRNDGGCGRSPTCHRKASTQDSDNTSHITDRNKELFEGLNNSVGKQ